jgi:hypothetical protein
LPRDAFVIRRLQALSSPPARPDADLDVWPRSLADAPIADRPV